jgi:biopolymer transport protein ExbD
MLQYGVRGRRSLPVNAEINLVNLVDVAFVLLIIFMITAPILQGGIQVELPQAEASPITTSDAVIVSVADNGDIYIDQARLGSVEEFEIALSAVLGDAPEEGEVVLKGDRSANWGRIVEVMGVMARLGVNLGVAVEALPDRTR